MFYTLRTNPLSGRLIHQIIIQNSFGPESGELIINHGDVRKHEETPQFIKNLLQCKSMHQEIVLSNEPERGADLTDARSGHVPLLGETPMTWIVTVAQRYIVGHSIFLSLC